jgi:hypothetical protein
MQRNVRAADIVKHEFKLGEQCRLESGTLGHKVEPDIHKHVGLQTVRLLQIFAFGR